MNNILPGMRAARQRAGLSVASVALRLGVTRQAVHAWELGIRVPSVSRLAELSAVLDCPVEALLAPPPALPGPGQPEHNTREGLRP